MKELIDELAYAYYRNRMSSSERQRFDQIAEAHDDGDSITTDEEEFLQELSDKFGL